MSIEYYNQHAQDFINRTKDLDVSTIADQFLGLVVDKGRILDLGCGSGRDAFYFREKGYDTYAIDGSEALVDYVRTFLGDHVQCCTYEAYITALKFDGIWAMASLLHVPEMAMVALIEKYAKLLKVGGIFFMSFKLYKENFSYEGRDFTCYDKIGLHEMLDLVNGLELIEIIETQSIKDGHDQEWWVNAFCRKKV